MAENVQFGSVPNDLFTTTEVYRNNVDKEMDRMSQCLKSYPMVAFDTEYPGIIRLTRPFDSPEESYFSLKSNVECTKLIQCGFTLFNSKGETGGTWEFNFSNFGDPTDIRNNISIDFLKKNGLDFDKIRKEGVDMFAYGFFPKLLSIFQSVKHVVFVTFQGEYDFGYFLSILNNGKLPETRGQFASEVVRVFGEVYDLKVMAGFCQGLGEHLGLSKLAQLLDVTRLGRAHHAGSDSLLTALVFVKIIAVHENSKVAKGMLHGVGKSDLAPLPVPRPMNVQEPGTQVICPVSYNSTYMTFHNGYLPPTQTPFFAGYLPPTHAPFFALEPWMMHNQHYGMYMNQQNHHHGMYMNQHHDMYMNQHHGMYMNQHNQQQYDMYMNKPNQHNGHFGMYMNQHNQNYGMYMNQHNQHNDMYMNKNNQHNDPNESQSSEETEDNNGRK